MVCAGLASQLEAQCGIASPCCSCMEIIRLVCSVAAMTGKNPRNRLETSIVMIEKIRMNLIIKHFQ